MNVLVNKKKIELLAFDRGWDIAELQRRTGMANGTLYSILSDRHKNVRVSTVSKIAKALGVEPRDIASIK